MPGYCSEGESPACRIKSPQYVDPATLREDLARSSGSSGLSTLAAASSSGLTPSPSQETIYTMPPGDSEATDDEVADTVEGEEVSPPKLQVKCKP